MNKNTGDGELEETWVAVPANPSAKIPRTNAANEKNTGDGELDNLERFVRNNTCVCDKKTGEELDYICPVHDLPKELQDTEMNEKEMLDNINSWDSVAKLLKLVDEIDTHIISLTGKDGKKYWVHRQETDLE